MHFSEIDNIIIYLFVAINRCKLLDMRIFCNLIIIDLFRTKSWLVRDVKYLIDLIIVSIKFCTGILSFGKKNMMNYLA